MVYSSPGNVAMRAKSKEQGTREIKTLFDLISWDSNWAKRVAGKTVYSAKLSVPLRGGGGLG